MIDQKQEEKAAEFEVVEVGPGSWTHLETLFEGCGGPKYCWCMAWRRKPAEILSLRSAERNQALKAQLCGIVNSGVPVGLLMFRTGEPIGWCSVAPRRTYRPITKGRDKGVAEEDIWSIACFYLRRDFRGRGFSSFLLTSAIEMAWRHGASIIEAYPVHPESPSYRFMGIVPRFEQFGFRHVGMAGKRRHVMQLRRSCRQSKKLSGSPAQPMLPNKNVVG